MLTAIRVQEYPKQKIEHIIMDGGSTNGMHEILRKEHKRVYVRRDLLDKPLSRMGLGISYAKNDLVLLLEPDNIIVGNSWLKQMVQPFCDDQKIVAAYSMHNYAEPDMPMFTRYCALFGINDPLVYYLQKSEKLPQFTATITRGNIIRHTACYSVVEFNRTNLPTLGDNGHMVRRTAIQHTYKNPHEYIHTDAFVRLLRKNKNRYAVVRNSVIHFTGSSLWDYFSRRIEYKRRYFDGKADKRQYLVYDANSSEDKKNLFVYILYSITLIQPFLLSVRGYMQVHDMAWFLHPLVCILGVFAYGYSEARRILHGYAKWLK